MSQGPFIVVSGLPAAGKTVIGRHVASRIGLPFLDKDDFLEREFDKYGPIDPNLRQRLSRKSDETMAARALAIGTGVLVSFWRPADSAAPLGTATDWLRGLAVPIVELYCRCEPAVAQRRFEARRRHPGHNDASRMDSLVSQFPELALQGPLGQWPVATVDTTNLHDPFTLADLAVEAVLALLGQDG